MANNVVKTLNGFPYPERVEVVNADGTAIGSAATISGALPAGNNNIGDVDVATLPALPAGTNTIGSVGVLSTRTSTTVTIADTLSLSGASAAFAGKTLAGIITPSGWTTAGLSFQASIDGTNWFVLLDSSGTEITAAAVAASRFVALDPSQFLGVEYVKVQSGTNAAAVAQASGDILTLVLV